jgi:hypothetical protein
VWSFTRREFLGTFATALPGSHAGAQFALSGLLTAYVYSAESIAPGVKTSPLVVGFLIARQPERHIRALASLKAKFKYRRQLTYRSNDAFKVECAGEFMRYFAQSDLRFAARVVRSSFGITDDVRTAQYPVLIKTARVPTSAIFRMKQHQEAWGFGRKRGSGVAEYRARIDALRRAGIFRPTEAVLRAAKDGLVELTSLLTGTLYGSLAVPAVGRSGPRWNPIKATGAERLRAALRVRDLGTSVAGKWEITLGDVGEPRSAR